MDNPRHSKRKYSKLPFLLSIIPRDHTRSFIITVNLKDIIVGMQVLYIVVSDNQAIFWYQNQDHQCIKETLDIRLEYEDRSKVEGLSFIAFFLYK